MRCRSVTRGTIGAYLAALLRGLSSIQLSVSTKEARAWMSALEDPTSGVKRPASALHDLVTTSKNARQPMSRVTVIVRFSPDVSRALTNRLSSLLGRETLAWSSAT